MRLGVWGEWWDRGRTSERSECIQNNVVCSGLLRVAGVVLLILSGVVLLILSGVVLPMLSRVVLLCWPV